VTTLRYFLEAVYALPGGLADAPTQMRALVSVLRLVDPAQPAPADSEASAEDVPGSFAGAMPPGEERRHCKVLAVCVDWVAELLGAHGTTHSGVAAAALRLLRRVSWGTNNPSVVLPLLQPACASIAAHAGTQDATAASASVLDNALSCCTTLQRAGRMPPAQRQSR
jgi:hypothetical protein